MSSGCGPLRLVIRHTPLVSRLRSDSVRECHVVVPAARCSVRATCVTTVRGPGAHSV